MKEVNITASENELKISLSGRIDSNNAREAESEIMKYAEQDARFFYKFNEKVILRTDAKTQMETLKDGVNNGIYKPNDARDYLDLPYDPAGNKLIVNGNYIPLEMVGQQYGISQEGGE